MRNPGPKPAAMRGGAINLSVRVSIPVLVLYVLATVAIGYFTFDGVRKLGRQFD